MTRFLRFNPSALRTIADAQGGTSAVEFALLAPIFLLIVAAAVDYGAALFTKFRLDNALTAAANYVVVNAANVSSSSGAGLATSVANVLATSGTSAAVTSVVVINNGPTATTSNGATTAGGTASNADLCYCPSRSGTTITWGSAASCSSTCSGGAPAGRYVSISVSRPYTTSFSSYGIVQSGTISSQAMVQAQ